MSNSMVKKHLLYVSLFFLADIYIFQIFIAFLDRIRPICLPISKELINQRFEGSEVSLAGWGYRKENGKIMPSALMQLQLPVLNNAFCRDLYHRRRLVKQERQFDDRVVCVGNAMYGSTKANCEGDSGSPLMLPIKTQDGSSPFYQIGVVSYAETCGKLNLPPIYTNVQHHAAWIKLKIGA